jgi:hypothetical protein
MTTKLQENNHTYSDPHVHSDAAWKGRISGLEAQDMLIGQTPYVYLLREGEYPSHYYVSFVRSDLTIQHQPFTITITPHGWYCRNGDGTGPFMNPNLQEVIHLIMHCKQEECQPLKNNQKA